jgi:hypothetical protein
MNKKTDSEFWKDINNNEIPDSLKENLSKWKYRLPIREDFSSSNYLLFYEYNWIHVLYGLNLLDIDLLKNHFLSFNKDDVDFFNNKLETINQYINTNIGHKNYLELIRNTNFV